MSGGIGQRLQPWAGLILGLAAVVTAHQFGADGEFDDCQRFAPAPLLIVALLCIVLALVGAGMSASIIRRSSSESSGRMVAIISTGFALLACFAILLPVLAALVLPPCFQ